MRTAFLISIASIAAFTQQAVAETYKFVFTEPFVTIWFDTETKEITVLEAINISTDEATGERLEVHRISKGTMRETGKDSWEIANEKRNVVVKLTLSNDGSDGMSDIVYPYTAYFGTNEGGGSSTTRPPKMPEDS